MEIYKASDILNKKFNSSLEKCRMCQKTLARSKISISSAIQSKFFDVTLTELPISNEYSKFICSKCDKELDEAYLYRKRLLEVLMKQCKETGEVIQTYQPEIVNLKQEKFEMELTEGYSNDLFMPESIKNEKFEDENEKSSNKSKKRRAPDKLKASIKIDSMIRDEGGETYYVCKYCDKNITTAYALKEHILTQHKDLEKKYVCDHEGCDKSYVVYSRLRAHQATHRDDKKAMCTICGAVLYSKKGLRDHIASVHEKDKKFFCDRCDYSAALKYLIRSHVNVHIERQNRRNHACHLCNFVSVCPRSLKLHLNDHKGLEFQCEYCGKSFTNKGALHSHVRCVHKKVKKHACEICGKKYFQRSDLHKHLASRNPCYPQVALSIYQEPLKHENNENQVTDETTHKGNTKKQKDADVDHYCHCGKVFSNKAALRVHDRCVHKKINKHVCDTCGMSFYNKIGLTNHNLAKHNTDQATKSFECSVCGKLFGLNKLLQEHMLRHQTRYTCEHPKCYRFFNSEERLQRHMKKHE